MHLTFYIFINYNQDMLQIIYKLLHRKIRWETPIYVDCYYLSKIIERKNGK